MQSVYFIVPVNWVSFVGESGLNTHAWKCKFLVYLLRNDELVASEREIERLFNREPLRFTLSWDRYIKNLAFSCFFYGRLIQSRFSNRGPPLPCSPGLAPKMLWFYSLLTDRRHIGDENFRRYIFYGRLQNAIHVVFRQSLIYLKTQLYVLFLKSTLTSLSKVNIYQI